MFAGLAESTMSRDDGWRFLLLGRSLERVDMTARLLSARYGESWGEAGWVTTLRCCCGAYEAYLRTYQRAVDVSLAAEFLVLDRLFPRSVFSALRTAESASPSSTRPTAAPASDDPARRSLGQARTELEFRSGDELVGDLPGHLYRLQQHCFDAGAAIAAALLPRDRPAGVEHMSWRLGIRHTSAYSYVENVVASYNEARITPLTTVGQVTIDARVEVTPPARPVSYWDYWGTLVHAFDIHVPHRELVVVGSSIVETPLSHGPTDHHAISWAELGDDAVGEAYFEYLAPTETTAADDGLDAIGATLRKEASTPQEALELVGDWVRAALVYERGSTSVSTAATDAWKNGRGVCQDFVQLAIALLRTMGIPARYVVRILPPAGRRPDRRHGARREPRMVRGVDRRLVAIRSDERRGRRGAPRARRPRPRLPRRPTAEGHRQRSAIDHAGGLGRAHPPRLREHGANGQTRCRLARPAPLDPVAAPSSAAGNQHRGRGPLRRSPAGRASSARWQRRTWPRATGRPSSPPGRPIPRRDRRPNADSGESRQRARRSRSLPHTDRHRGQSRAPARRQIPPRFLGPSPPPTASHANPSPGQGRGRVLAHSPSGAHARRAGERVGGRPPETGNGYLQLRCAVPKCPCRTNLATSDGGHPGRGRRTSAGVGVPRISGSNPSESGK